jgi:hypothetical protein
MRYPTSKSAEVTEVTISKTHNGFDCCIASCWQWTTLYYSFLSDYHRGGRLSNPGPRWKFLLEAYELYLLVKFCVRAIDCDVDEQTCACTKEAIRVSGGTVPLIPNLCTRLVVTDANSYRWDGPHLTVCQNGALSYLAYYDLDVSLS